MNSSQHRRGADAAKPNVLLIMTDQQRGDALGIEGHPVLETPYLDEIASEGVRFRRAYSASPLCIPARRTILTGAKPASHGVISNYHAWLDLETVPESLSREGYQTHLVGKLHLWPWRKLYGFQSADWADRPFKKQLNQPNDDYQDFLVDNGVTDVDAGQPHGGSDTGWIGRPFHLPDRLHFTNWCTQRALKFLQRRDTTRPFFLNVSYHQPHGPCTPPAYYFDKYMAKDIPPLPAGEWAKQWAEPKRGLGVSAARVLLEKEPLRAFMAGYYGCIEQIDHQIGLLLRHVPENTIVVFCSDHGELLGQHQWMRKRLPYEGSIRVPMLMRFPRQMRLPQPQQCSRLVELMDLMPTILDAVGAPIPDTVDGASLMPLIRGRTDGWRTHLHGECAHTPAIAGRETGMQYVLTDTHKYIYYPGAGVEQFFDLGADPLELTDLIDDKGVAELVRRHRALLIGELENRPEGFVRDGELVRLDSRSAPCLPGYETNATEPI